MASSTTPNPIVAKLLITVTLAEDDHTRLLSALDSGLPSIIKGVGLSYPNLDTIFLNKTCSNLPAKLRPIKTALLTLIIKAGFGLSKPRTEQDTALIWGFQKEYVALKREAIRCNIACHYAMWSCMKVIDMGYMRAMGGDTMGGAEAMGLDTRDRFGMHWDAFVAEQRI